MRGWPGHPKALHFRKVFPHRLICNEWLETWPMKLRDRETTYNPDFWCPKRRVFIEVATSLPNLGQQRGKWQQAILDKRPLLVYWWTGLNITRALFRPSFDLMKLPRLYLNCDDMLRKQKRKRK